MNREVKSSKGDKGCIRRARRILRGSDEGGRDMREVRNG